MLLPVAFWRIWKTLLFSWAWKSKRCELVWAVQWLTAIGCRTPFLRRNLFRSWMCHFRQQEEPACLGTLYSAGRSGGLCFPALASCTAIAGLCLPVLNLLLDSAEVSWNSVVIMFYLPAIPIPWQSLISLLQAWCLWAASGRESLGDTLAIVCGVNGCRGVVCCLSVKQISLCAFKVWKLECCLRASSAAVSFVTEF